MAVVYVAERQIEATFQQKVANGCAQLDAGTPTESPIKLLLDGQLMLRIGSIGAWVIAIQVGISALAQGEDLS